MAPHLPSPDPRHGGLFTGQETSARPPEALPSAVLVPGKQSSPSNSIQPSVGSRCELGVTSLLLSPTPRPNVSKSQWFCPQNMQRLFGHVPNSTTQSTPSVASHCSRFYTSFSMPPCAQYLSPPTLANRGTLLLEVHKRFPPPSKEPLWPSIPSRLALWAPASRPEPPHGLLFCKAPSSISAWLCSRISSWLVSGEAHPGPRVTHISGRNDLQVVRLPIWKEAPGGLAPCCLPAACLGLLCVMCLAVQLVELKRSRSSLEGLPS